MTQIITSLREWQTITHAPRYRSQQIGFVPTMGNLHAGHASLLARARAENEYVVLSIFVNPTQFNDPQDFARYPRTLENDIKLAETHKVDYILSCDKQDFYPDEYHYCVYETELSQILCGAHRPGHFEGMLTIVLKLLNLVQPTRAYFGEKDWQQLQLIRGMVQAFFLDVEVVGCPIIRDENGLALSSRNSLLSAEEYQLALHFPRLLQSNLTLEAIDQTLQALGIEVDYLEEMNGRRLGAVKVGNTRLIDNIPISQ